MLVDNTYETWAADIKNYEKEKRTKKPFGKTFKPCPEFVTFEKVKAEELKYNPILGRFNSQGLEEFNQQKEQFKREEKAKSQLRQVGKYAKPFDIVNLHPEEETAPPLPRRKYQFAKPRRFNIVNNQLYYQDTGNREGFAQFRKVPNRNARDYDIINNYYNYDHENKVEDETKHAQASAMDKYWRTHDFDPVAICYYDEDKEMAYNHEVKQKQLVHGQSALQRLPQSYRERQEVILDPSKDVPEEVKQLDLKRKNAKRRYETRYAVEMQLKQKDILDFERQESTIKSKLHHKKVEVQLSKPFDIINLRDSKAFVPQNPFPKTTWDKVLATRDRPNLYQTTQSDKATVKSGAFDFA